MNECCIMGFSLLGTELNFSVIVPEEIYILASWKNRVTGTLMEAMVLSRDQTILGEQFSDEKRLDHEKGASLSQHRSQRTPDMERC